MFSQQGWMAVQTTGGFREFERQTSLLDCAQGGVMHLLEHVPGQDLGIGENVGDIVDRATGDTGVVEDPNPVRRRLRFERLGQRFFESRSILHALGIRHEPGILRQVGPVDGLTQALPVPLVGTTNREIAVARGERLIWG